MEPVNGYKLYIFVGSTFHPAKCDRDITAVKFKSYQKRFNIRNQLFLTFCLSLFIETLQSVFRECQFSIKNRLPCHQTVRHKDLLQLSPAVSLHSAVRKQRSHLIAVFSLFKKALRQCQIHKSLAVFSEHERHNLTDAASKLYITFGPLTKILATVHHRGQIGGHRKLR